MAAGKSWKVRVEEPTGLYRRVEEVVRIPTSRLGGDHNYAVVAAGGRELPCQTSAGELLFPVSIMPGELPEYQVGIRLEPPGDYAQAILLRRVGGKRIELGNSRFRMVLDAEIPAIVEAYSLTSGPQRALNYVETTPESQAALGKDIQGPGRPDAQVTPIEGENLGWTTLGGQGPMTGIILAEKGPLRGRLILQRSGEAWELVWYAHQAALEWKAVRGFRFTAVSAQPFLPFDRFLDGSEYEWPTGSDSGEPPNHQLAARNWSKLPGGHAVYYNQKENYGALGLVALDPDLTWKGIGSRRFLAEKASGETRIAITFPEWHGSDTVLEARKEYRQLRQPLIWQIRASEEDPPTIQTSALREPKAEVETFKAEDASHVSPAPADTAPDASFCLDGEWELAWAEKGEGPPKEGWRTVNVPGSAHVQWLDRSKIYSREAEWISGKEWWYRKGFAVPAHFHGQRVRLQFEATDYYADIWLNGKMVGHHEGYIDPYFLEVASGLRYAETNQLLVRVWAPVNYYWKHRSYTIKGAYGAVDQKPDDITPLGITRSVRLVAANPVVIDDVAIETRLTDQGAELIAQVKADGELDEEEEYQWELLLSPRNFEAPERYRLRQPLRGKDARLVLPVSNPQLWWTWDHGRPNLYTLEVRLVNAAGRVVDRQVLPVGIREIEKRGWIFYLNRKRLFIRGTNYYYHLYLSEMNREAYARDVELMLQMNVNLIRLHCHFSNRELYDLADEKGVLLWQDFLEAWYPHDRGFSLRAAELYDPLIRYARNHPCVALWTTSDEEDLENYTDLTKHLAPRPSFLDPQLRPVVRSTGRYGDAHVYHGWYGGTLWDYTRMTEAFVSELGATCLPNYETLIQFMPGQWPIQDHAAEWFFRRLQIPEAMRAWGEPGSQSLQEYVPRTQAYVSRLFQIALERMRRLKYNPAGGICHFHAIDIWPSVTMAAIDFNRRPTQVFYTVQRSLAPVAACFDYTQDRWRSGAEFRCGLWAINDRWEAVPNATIRWRIQTASQELQKKGEWKISLPEDSAQKLGEVEWKTKGAGAFELWVEVVGASGELISENLFEFTVSAP